MSQALDGPVVVLPVQRREPTKSMTFRSTVDATALLTSCAVTPGGREPRAMPLNPAPPIAPEYLRRGNWPRRGLAQSTLIMTIPLTVNLLAVKGALVGLLKRPRSIWSVVWSAALVPNVSDS